MTLPNGYKKSTDGFYRRVVHFSSGIRIVALVRLQRGKLIKTEKIKYEDSTTKTAAKTGS